MHTSPSKKDPHTRASGYKSAGHLSTTAGICIQLRNSLNFLIRRPPNKEDDYVLRSEFIRWVMSEVPEIEQFWEATDLF